MRIAPFVFAVVACKEDNIVPDTAGGSVVMNPLCGGAGTTTASAFIPESKRPATASRPARAERASWTATVPEAARTGTVEVATSGPFTIPCPGDSGVPDAPLPDGGPDSSVPAGPPL